MLLRACLRLPGFAYGCVMRLRRIAYETGFFQSRRFDIPVISIGNLTAGGSGKTPAAMQVCREILDLGICPGLILRGYRSDQGVSDEAELFRYRLPDIVVSEGVDRVEAGIRAIADGAGALVVDDGFQHLKLKRDFDIVLIDALSPWGGGVCFPGGLLREPKAALTRAGAVVITRADQCSRETLARLKAEIVRLVPKARLFSANHHPTRLIREGNQPGPSLGWLRGQTVVAVCGIARPEAFALTLTGLGAKVVKVLAVADHCGFDPVFAARVSRDAQRCDGVVIVTEKDAAKKSFANLLKAVDTRNKGLLILGIDLKIDDPEGFRSLIAETIGGHRNG